MNSDWGRAAALLCVVAFVKFYLAGRWGLLADEAYYWVWSQALSVSYYDQPGATAWWIAASNLIGDSEIMVRSTFLLCGLLAPVVQGWATGRPLFAVVWWACVPLLFWLTSFATPDAILLWAWCLGLAFAIRGGKWWLMAGLASSVASYAKLIGLGLMPLLVIGAARKERRSVWMRMAIGVHLVSMIPLLRWNAANHWVNFVFQFREGLWHHSPPGILGVVQQQVGQFGFVSPLVYLGVLAWACATGPGQQSHADRLAWWGSVPVMVFFLLCSPFAPAEAHWPGVAYVGAGFALGSATGRMRRLVDLGLGLGLGLTCLFVSHSLTPWMPLMKDPGTRLTEGKVLAAAVRQWIIPEGVSPEHWDGQDSVPILTERYQEAALISYYLPVRAVKAAKCGRFDEYDRLAESLPEQALFVRPSTSGYAACLDSSYAQRSSPARSQGIDQSNRLVGEWDIIEYNGLY